MLSNTHPGSGDNSTTNSTVRLTVPSQFSQERLCRLQHLDSGRHRASWRQTHFVWSASLGVAFLFYLFALVACTQAGQNPSMSPLVLIGILGLFAIAACWTLAGVLYRVGTPGSVGHQLFLLLVMEGITLATAGFPEFALAEFRRRVSALSPARYFAHPAPG